MKNEHAPLRRQSRTVYVGSVKVGGDAPISIQSMTNTDTKDVSATLLQIQKIADMGADFVRLSVPDEDSVRAFGRIKKESPLPLVADIHFSHQLAIASAKVGADCLRINPGNIPSARHVAEVARCAKDYNIPIRIGVNAGSLGKRLLDKYSEPNADALVESAMDNLNMLEDLDFHAIKLSLKASNVRMMVAAYQKIATLTDVPLHLGVTESGTLQNGTIKSSIGIGSLLLLGIGDTIRVSLAAEPEEEIKVGWKILKSLDLRTRGASLIACPSCARQNFNVIQVATRLEEMLESIQEDIAVSTIGCIVNGPGEAKMSQVGITGGHPNHLLYVDGEVVAKVPSSLSSNMLAQRMFDEVCAYLQTKEKIKENTIAKS